MTPDELRRILPRCGARADVYAEPLTEAMKQFDINTPQRQAAFLSQLGHESGHLSAVSENLNYSAEALVRTWPKRFPSTEVAEQYARQPEKIANRVYANRMGNGPEDSGDGWQYRGAGLIQLTGKENHLACAMFFQLPLDRVGDWLRTPVGAALSAAWFWKANNLNRLADEGDQVKLTMRINGGTNGLAERLALYEIAKEVLA